MDADLALGELRGALTAFGWVNGKTDHGYTFTFERLPAAATVGEAVRLHVRGLFGIESAVTADPLPDWRADVGKVLKRWLFGYLTDRHAKLTDPGGTFTVSGQRGRREVAGWVAGLIERAVAPSAAWKVWVETGMHYECGWDDFVFETAAGFYWLHLGVSD